MAALSPTTPQEASQPVRKKIIQLENMPFSSPITVGSHHYARFFAEDYDVLWISLPWHLLQLLTGRSLDRVKAWNFNRPNRVSPRLTTLCPFTPLPYRNNPILRSDFLLENLYSLMPGVLRAIRKLGFGSPDLLWFTDPRHLSILKHLKANKVFYRCVDNLEHFQDVPFSLMAHERNLIRNADATFFTSRALMTKFSGLTDKVHYLPNGCDLERFSNLPMRQDVEPGIRTHFRENRINLLYTGAIASWFDFGFLREISTRPDVHLVIVGPQKVPIPPDLQGKENVVFTGPYPYEAMPQFAALADVGIIPFLLNDITHSVNPIKLHEYCAAGLPTLVSRFKTVVDLAPPVVFYESGSIDKALDEIKEKSHSEAYQTRLKIFAQTNSWKQRYELIKTEFAKS